MGASVIVLAIFSGIPDHYLMAGHVESDQQSSPFVVVITPGRCLVGGLGGYGGAFFQYTGAHERSVQINWKSASTESLAVSGGQLETVLLSTRQITPTPEGHRRAVEVAAFSNFPFALFFSFDYLGVSADTVGKGGIFRNNCGELRITGEANGAYESIEFEQQESDLLTVRLPDQTLAKTTHPYPEGRKNILFRTQFTPPFDGSQTEWVADCLWECTTRTGAIHRNKNRIVVKEFITDVPEIHRRIDEYLKIIPDGEPVRPVADDPLSYVWKDGKVVRYVDQPAVAAAAEAQFHRATSRRWIYLALIVLAIATVLFLLARRPSAK